RWITPVIAQPALTVNGEREFGLGDINPSFFFSPKQPTHGIIWGIGPTFVFPTGTDKTLTAGKYSAGPAFVALAIEGPWVVGVLVNNVWSFAGKSNRSAVNAMTLQPFVNYNFHGGWYLTSSPSSPPTGKPAMATAGRCRSEAVSGACSRWAISPSTRSSQPITTSQSPAAPPTGSSEPSSSSCSRNSARKRTPSDFGARSTAGTSPLHAPE
ncbi:hypothetical protein AB4099_23155, partial [Bosea sp. 2KB_26]